METNTGAKMLDQYDPRVLRKLSQTSKFFIQGLDHSILLAGAPIAQRTVAFSAASRLMRFC